MSNSTSFKMDSIKYYFDRLIEIVQNDSLEYDRFNNDPLDNFIVLDIAETDPKRLRENIIEEFDHCVLSKDDKDHIKNVIERYSLRLYDNMTSPDVKSEILQYVEKELSEFEKELKFYGIDVSISEEEEAPINDEGTYSDALKVAILHKIGLINDIRERTIKGDSTVVAEVLRQIQLVSKRKETIAKYINDFKRGNSERATTMETAEAIIKNTLKDIIKPNR